MPCSCQGIWRTENMDSMSAGMMGFLSEFKRIALHPARICRDGLSRVAGTVATGIAPALLGSLAGDSEAGGDVGPAVAAGAESCDGVAEGGVDVAGDARHGGNGLDGAGGDAAAVGGQDAAEEGGVLVVLYNRPSPFQCQRLVDSRCVFRALAGVSHGRRSQSAYRPPGPGSWLAGFAGPCRCRFGCRRCVRRRWTFRRR